MPAGSDNDVSPSARSGRAAAATSTVMVAVGPVADFPVERFRVLDVGDARIGVFRTRDDHFVAVRDSCPHAGAPICADGVVGDTLLPSAPGQCEAGLDSRVLRCPWHQYEFDLITGRALFGAHPFRLRTYPIRVRGGVVEISMRPSRPRRAEAEDVR